MVIVYCKSGEVVKIARATTVEGRRVGLIPEAVGSGADGIVCTDSQGKVLGAFVFGEIVGYVIEDSARGEQRAAPDVSTMAGRGDSSGGGPGRTIR